MPMINDPILLLRPQTVDFGLGRAALIGAWAVERGLERILVVTDGYNGQRIDALGLKSKPIVFDKVKSEPDLPNLESLLALAEKTNPDLIIGFGGGSAMDIAKLVAVLPGTGKTLHDVVGTGKVGPRRAALVQVPTTAGTGSEAGMRSLITDPATRSKLAVESREMLADLAVVDPFLGVSLPAAITAATGVDALAHCVEAYTSKRSHPVIDIYAIEGIRLVGRFLKRAVEDGGDIEARSAMALASLYGGFCLGPVNTTAGHALSYPLGTRHQLAHGLSNALIFPHTLAFNAPASSEKTANILSALGNDGTEGEEAIAAAASAFAMDLGIDMRLSAHGVSQEDLPAMADDAAQIRRLLDHNPRDISRDDILRLYQTAY